MSNQPTKVPFGYPKGLISFCYHATYDYYVNAAFMLDPGAVMTEFGLSEQEQAAVTKAGNSGSLADMEAVTNMMAASMAENYSTVW